MFPENPTRTLVILGAGVGGLPLTHHVLRFTVPKMPNLRVILVTPDTHFYWNLGSPRAMISEDFTDKLFQPLAPAFVKYGDKFELIHGKAESLDPDRNSVVVALADGGTREIAYDTVVVATGSSNSQGMPWKSLSSTTATKNALQNLRQRIDGAKTIVVAGAGATGVEVTGELAEFSAAGTKQITYVIPNELPLAPPAKDPVRNAIRSALEKRNVKIIPNARVTSIITSKSSDGSETTSIELTTKDGTTQILKADVYLPAFGVTPNTAFAPAHLLAPSGQIKQTTRLRAEGYDNVFVLGDAGNLEDTRSISTDSQTHYLGRALQAYFVGGEVEEYKPSGSFMIGVSIGKDTGAGQAMGVKVFGWIIWYFKSRTLGIEFVADIVAGVRTITRNLKG